MIYDFLLHCDSTIKLASAVAPGLGLNAVVAADQRVSPTRPCNAPALCAWPAIPMTKDPATSSKIQAKWPQWLYLQHLWLLSFLACKYSPAGCIPQEIACFNLLVVFNLTTKNLGQDSMGKHPHSEMFSFKIVFSSCFLLSSLQT